MTKEELVEAKRKIKYLENRIKNHFRIVGDEEVEKIGLNCSACHEILGSCFVDNITMSKALGSSFLCPDCTEKLMLEPI